ncbi:MAG: phosphoserine phosphatase SerB [Acidimicrobiia bacterium]
MTDATTILVTINADDRPGITAGLMEVLSRTGAEIYDVEQIVVRGRLTLNILIGVGESRGTISELLFYGWEKDLRIEFDAIEASPEEPALSHVVTVIGARVSPQDFGAVAEAIASGGGNIDRIFRLSRYPVISYELAVSGGDPVAIRQSLLEAASASPIDVAIQPESLDRRAKRLVVMDVDSTLIQGEIIDVLAERAGVGTEVAVLTAQAMAGEIEFEPALRKRVAMLAGLPVSVFDEVNAVIQPTPGARTFVRTLRRMGMKTAIVSAGFTRFTDSFAATLGIDYSLANTLEVKDGVLTGEIEGKVVDRARKAEFLRELADREGITLSQTVAVGDGANDLDMLAAAGLGIAFNAKQLVKDNADTSLSVPYLDAILFVMGVRREHVEAADALDPDLAGGSPIPVKGTPPI